MATAHSLTARQWLAAQGLAVEFGADGVTPARGRFSNDAKAALDKARAAGDTFADDKAKRAPAPAPVPTPGAAPAQGATRVTPAKQASYDAKAVRSWAKANGVKVGDRGKIHSSVIEAFVKAGGKATRPTTSQRRAPSPLDMPKVRRETTGYTVQGGALIRQDSCGSCKVGVSRCSCKGGPVAYSAFGGQPLSLDKPAL